MIIKINSNEVSFTGNPALGRNVKEEFDSGKIVIVSTKDTRYEMYDKVDVTTPYEAVEQYLVQADVPVQLNATEYEHTVTLFENIAYFDTMYPADRSFKVIGQTLEDILTVYKREFEAYQNIKITWTTIPQEVLDETIPFKEFSGLNFSSILLSLFRKIWAVPKVNRIGNVWDIYPQYHYNRNSKIPSESISKLSQQNNVDYATKVKSQLKNAVNERTEGEVTWFPSENGYVFPRSSSLEKITSKLQYELDSNIVTILKAEAVSVYYKALNLDNNPPTTDDFFLTVDITNRIIQKDIHDMKPITTADNIGQISLTDNNKNYVRYKVGEPYITNLFEASTGGIIFKYDTEYLINAIYKEVADNKDTYFVGNYSSIAMQPLDTEDVKMRFKYVRQRDIDLVHNRKTKGVMNTSTTIHQQRDSSVELNEYKKNLKIYSNRMGNNEYSKTKVFNYPKRPYELFDYTDDKTIVTKVLNTYHNTFVYCEYEESENFSNIEAEYALMRRSDPYTITSKSVTTNLIRNEFVEFSTASKPVVSRLEDDARRLIGGQFETSPIALNKVAVGVFKPVLTSWNNDYAIHMPVEASGDADSITLHVQFPHQSIASKTYYDLENDTLQTYLNPLPYTDSDGRLEDFQLYFTPDIQFEDTGEYPLILDETDYLADKYTESGVDEPIDLDSAASFAKTFQISLVADENIYIGNTLARDNYFVKDQVLPAPAIKIYTSTKPYGQYDQAPRASDTDNTANITYNYSYTNRTITITPNTDIDYFCIVRNNKILLAVNQAVSSDETFIIYVNYLQEITVAVYLEAISGPLSNFSGSATITYTSIEYVLEADSSPLANISGSGTLEYTYIEYTLEAISGTLSNISGSGTISYTQIEYDLEAISSPLSSVSGSATIVYTSRLYTLEFVNYDGTVLQTGDYESGTSLSGVTPPSDPTRPDTDQYDYEFDDWSSSIPSTMPDNDVTITAEYTRTLNTYDVYFRDWNGTVLKSSNVGYGSSVTPPADPTRSSTVQYDYEFSGWDSNDYLYVTGTTYITAEYTATLVKYRVSFDNEGALYDEQDVEYGTYASTPSGTPSKASDNTYDYTFSYWNDITEPITGDTTIYAVYTSAYRTDVSWQDTTSTTQSGDNTCDNVLDIGNVKTYTQTVCVYKTISEYKSTINETTTIPACSVGAEYTLCIIDKTTNPFSWNCTDYEGELQQQPFYKECKFD